MRSDARQNRDRLLEAATWAMLEAGPQAPLDSIARRAEVGIATLYRHFPDRDALINGVAQHAIERSVAAARTVMEKAADGFEALRRYMHAAVDLGVGILNLLYPMITDPEWSKRRSASAALLEGILERGQSEGLIRTDIRVPDIGFAIIRFSRPVASDLLPAQERLIAHRHLDIYIDGLHTGAHVTTPLPAARELQQVGSG